MGRRSSPERVAADIAALRDLPREDLAQQWARRFGREPPKGCGRRLLELAVAYGIQEQAFGGLKSESRKTLASEKTPTGDAAASSPGNRRKGTSSVKLGTRLVREWNGRTHHVEVADGGFIWNGKKYRSLSIIAREITGAHWSGPRFFGP